jgi:hypothetical protein
MEPLTFLSEDVRLAMISTIDDDQAMDLLGEFLAKHRYRYPWFLFGDLIGDADVRRGILRLVRKWYGGSTVPVR